MTLQNSLCYYIINSYHFSCGRQVPESRAPPCCSVTYYSIDAILQDRWNMKKELEPQITATVSKYEILLLAVELGSIGKAAEALNYTQSGLTYMLNTLEADLGISILNRTHKGVSFSENGHRLEPYIRAMVDSERELRKKITELVADDTEIVRIGAISSIAKYCAPALIREFKKEYPRANIFFRTGNGQEIPKLVRENLLDIALVDTINSEGFDCIPLMKEQLYAAIPAEWTQIPVTNGSVSLDDLADYPILYMASNPKNAGNLVMQNKQLDEKIMVSSDGNTIMLMIAQGLGFALLPQRYSIDCPDTVKMYPTSPPIRRTIGVITKSLMDLNPMPQRFVQMLQRPDIIKNILS